MTTAVSVWSGETWAADGSEDFDAMPGDIKIVSAVSTMEGASRNVGKFWHSDRGGDRAFDETLDVVPLMVRTGRTFFAFGNPTPLCRSNDGKTIEPGQPLWGLEAVRVSNQGPEVEVPPEPRGCETCQFSRWEGNTEPPLCGEAKVVLMVRKDDESLARFRFTKTAIKVLSKFIRQEVVGARRPLYSHRLTISLSEVSSGGKKWFEPKFKAVDVSLDEARAYSALVAQQRQRFEMPEAEDADFSERPATQATQSGPSPDGRDYSAFWADIDGLGYTREQREDVLSMIAPAASLAEIGEEEMWGLIPQISAALNGAKPSEMSAGERRVVVEKVKAMRNPLPEVTPADLTPRSDVAAGKQASLK